MKVSNFWDLLHVPVIVTRYRGNEAGIVSSIRSVGHFIRHFSAKRQSYSYTLEDKKKRKKIVSGTQIGYEIQIQHQQKKEDLL